MLQRRSWVPARSDDLVQTLAAAAAQRSVDANDAELVRLGMEPAHMEELAGYIARALGSEREAAAVAAGVTGFRRRFGGALRYVRA